MGNNNNDVRVTHQVEAIDGGRYFHTLTHVWPDGSGVSRGWVTKSPYLTRQEVEEHRNADRPVPLIEEDA